MVDKELMYNSIVYDVEELRKYIKDLEERSFVTFGNEEERAQKNLDLIKESAHILWNGKLK